MKFGRTLVLSLATLLVAVPAVYAQDDMGDLTTKKPARKQTVEEENNDPSRSGVLFGIGAVLALDNFSGVGMSTDISGGFNAQVGYRFNRWFSSNLHVERYQQFDGHKDGSDVGEVNGWSIGLDGRGYILPGRVQPFGLIGIALLDMETTNSTASNANKTDDGPALRFGAGVDVYATNRLIVTTDVSYLLGLAEVDGYDMVLFSLGFQFRP